MKKKNYFTKGLSVLLVLVMVLATFAALPLTASAAMPAVIPYDMADDGELLYTIDFNGTDGFFSPGLFESSVENMDYTISADGSALTVSGKQGGTDKTGNFWGGKVKGLYADETTTYTMVYKVKANGTTGKNNSVGVGGWIIDEASASFYNNYANHNTITSTGSIADRRSALSWKTSKMNGSNTTDTTYTTSPFGYTDKYVYWTEKGTAGQDGYYAGIGAYDTTDDFVTMMIVFDGPTKKFHGYVLKSGATTDVTNASNWIYLETASLDFNGLGENSGMGFAVYAHYLDVNTTIKDVDIYKGNIIATSTAANVVISSAADLSALSTTIAGLDLTGKTAINITLAGDIDMAGQAYTPVAETTLPVHFNGKGYTISNLTMGTTETPATDAAALFVKIAGGSTFRNVTFANISIVSEKEAAALIAKGTIGNLTVTNVHVSGSITSTGAYAGGFVGRSYNATGDTSYKLWTVSYCTNSANISSYRNGGGFIARAVGNYDFRVKYWANKGNIAVTNTNQEGASLAAQDDDIGGFLGRLNHGGAAPDATHHVFEFCYNTGDFSNEDNLEAASTSIGGLLGNYRTYQGGSVSAGTAVSTFTMKNCFDYSARTIKSFADPDVSDANKLSFPLVGFLSNGEFASRDFENCYGANKTGSTNAYTDFFKVNSIPQTVSTVNCGIATAIDAPVDLKSGSTTIEEMMAKIDAAITTFGEVELPKGAFADGKERDYTWYYNEGALVAKGTEAAPYEIASAAQWAALSALSVGSQNADAVGGNEAAVDFDGKYFKLTADIDMTGYTIAAISGNYPTIVLDGQNKTISNLAINGNGLFTQLGVGSVIKNLKLVNVDISGSGNVGGLAGAAKGGVEVYNVTLDADSSVVSADGNAGALIGLINDTTTTPEEGEIKFTYVVTAASVTGDNQTGGLLGRYAGLVNITIDYCVSKGTVTLTRKTGAHICLGGLIGHLGAGSADYPYVVSITNSYHTGTLVAETTSDHYVFAGGTIGWAQVNNYSELFVDNFYDYSVRNLASAKSVTNGGIGGNGAKAELKKFLNNSYVANTADSQIAITNWTGFSQYTTLVVENCNQVDTLETAIVNKFGNASTMAAEMAKIDTAIAGLTTIPDEGGSQQPGGSEPTTPTDPTEPGTTETTKPADDTTTTEAPAEEKKGCGSSVSAMYAVLALTAIVGCAFVAKRKEEN